MLTRDLYAVANLLDFFVDIQWSCVPYMSCEGLFSFFTKLYKLN